jgi:hypothetical protein
LDIKDKAAIVAGFVKVADALISYGALLLGTDSACVDSNLNSK